jgi:hypothetical protein
MKTWRSRFVVGAVCLGLLVGVARPVMAEQQEDKPETPAPLPGPTPALPSVTISFDKLCVVSDGDNPGPGDYHWIGATVGGGAAKQLRLDVPWGELLTWPVQRLSGGVCHQLQHAAVHDNRVYVNAASGALLKVQLSATEVDPLRDDRATGDQVVAVPTAGQSTKFLVVALNGDVWLKLEGTISKK